MEKLESMLEMVAKLPYRRYEPDTILAVGSMGLWMNTCSSKLFQMKKEFAYAQEYLQKSQSVDVAETMQEYKKTLEILQINISRKRFALLKCPESDEEVKRILSDFFLCFEEELMALQRESDLRGDEASLEEQVSNYQAKLAKLCEICDAYLKLRIGDMGPLDGTECDICST